MCGQKQANDRGGNAYDTGEVRPNAQKAIGELLPVPSDVAICFFFGGLKFMPYLRGWYPHITHALTGRRFAWWMIRIPRFVRLGVQPLQLLPLLQGKFLTLYFSVVRRLSSRGLVLFSTYVAQQGSAVKSSLNMGRRRGNW